MTARFTTTSYSTKLVIFALLFNFSSILHADGRIHAEKLSPFQSTAPFEKDASSPNKPITGSGSASYQIKISASGWYELWVNAAAAWPTDLWINNKRIRHTSLRSKTWNHRGDEFKVLNLHLAKGTHLIRLDRLYFPGLPYLRYLYLLPSADLTGQVQATPASDHLVFRKNENFTLHLETARQATKDTEIRLQIYDAISERIIHKQVITIPNGTGLYRTSVSIPTHTEGVFNLALQDKNQKYVDRIQQYIVIDTEDNSHHTQTQLHKELLYSIDPLKSPPKYNSKRNTHAVNQGNLRYLESTDTGVYEDRKNPDFFAYTLKLPEIGQLYMAEIDYPDDKPRAFTISLIDEHVNPYALDAGVSTGAPYSLSHTNQTTQIYFYARTKNPRLLFLNWHSKQNIALSNIKIYKVREPLPPLLSKPSARKFGMYFEETLRFTTYFGATPKEKDWTELYKTALRWAQWSNFIGVNFWLQTIAIYQSKMWPSELLPGYAPAEEDGYGLLGPDTDKDPFQKDLLRLLLLIGEKYNIDIVGELHIPMIGFIKHGLDSMFGNDGKIKHNSTQTPWLIVSKDGKIGSNDLSLPYLNPVNPEVQNWIRSLVIELASRYRDSPQFTGVAIRLMGWAFSSWQTFPSINWGYGDYTASRFEQDTGIRIPISATDPLRFRKRYDWLMSNHYNDWIEWRCATIYSFHKSISDELLRARQDLKLYVNMFGPHYSAPDWNNKGGTIARLTALQGDGWNRLAKEAGIDVEKYKNNDSIILSNSAHYPAGIRAKGDNAARVAELQRLETTDPFPIQASIKPHDSGTSSATRFYNAYMEHDFPVAKLGFKSLTFRKNESLRIAGAINPAGKHILHRYANALANGNLTRIIDGGLGYILNQPLHISEFLTEYHSLPNIGMQKLANNKSKLTLWMGKKSEELYFYLVNPTDQAAEVQLVFSTPPQLIQLSTGLPFAEGTSKTVLLSLTGYKLLALKNSVKESELIRVEDMNRD